MYPIAKKERKSLYSNLVPYLIKFSQIMIWLWNKGMRSFSKTQQPPAAHNITGPSSDSPQADLHQMQKIREWICVYLLTHSSPVWLQDSGIDFGDVSDRKALRKRLQCKTFRWYLVNMYPEMRMYSDTVAYGAVSCLRSSSRLRLTESVPCTACVRIQTNAVTSSVLPVPLSSRGWQNFYVWWYED